MSLPTNGIPISGLTELTELQDSGDWVIVQNSNGTYKMQASALCWPLVDLLCSGDIHTRNGIFRGKNLTDVYTVDELQAKVAAGDWSDLFIGDYIDVTPTESPFDGSETVRLRFAHFDYFLNCGYTALTNHHIVMIPESAFSEDAATIRCSSVMELDDTTANGYGGSRMHNTTLPKFYDALNSTLNGHILTHYRHLSNDYRTSFSSGASNNQQVNLCLMSEPMVYGGVIGGVNPEDVNEACIQLALFALAPDMRVATYGYGNDERVSWWLAAAADTYNFACCDRRGAAHLDVASTELGVRPYFLFG